MAGSSNDKREVICPHCGRAFQVFLKEMAAHNAQVVCPHCGASHPATILSEKNNPRA